MYIYVHVCWRSPGGAEEYGQSPYLDYGFQRVRLEQNLNGKGWNSQANGEFPGKFQSSSLGRDNLRILVERLGVIPGAQSREGHGNGRRICQSPYDVGIPYKNIR